MIHQEVAQPVYHPAPDQAAAIKLIGVGGGGCNAVEHMIGADIHGVDFTLVNTDSQALARYNPDNVIQLGTSLTRGLGAGTDPEVGRLAAEEDADLIAATIGDTDMLFLTAGMGGGTGTGAIPVIARIARELGILTVAVVTKPFAFEGGKRRQVAEVGLAELRRHVDSLIVVPNENLLTHLGPNISLIEAFAASNDVLTNAVQSIAELITNPGLINVDFADVKSVMTETGEAMMSTGRGIGEYRARDAAIAATESPLLEEIDLNEARGILANITASDTLSMGEFQIVGDILDQITAENANVVIGTVFDADMNDEIRVTVVATGLQSNEREPAPQPQSKKPASAGFLGFGANRSASRPNGNKPDNRSARAGYRDLPDERPPVQPPRPSRVEQTIARAHKRPTYVEPEYNDYDDHAPSPYEQRTREERPQRDLTSVEREPEVPLCNACGNSPDDHTDNCPLQEPTPPKQVGSLLLDERSQLDDLIAGTSQAAAEQQPAQSRSAAADTPDTANPGTANPGTANHRTANHGGAAKTRAQAGNDKKKPFNKHVAGLVTGAVVLVSVFYLLISNKLSVDEPPMAEAGMADSNVATNDIAGRKLRDAQRRLSGL